VEIAEWLDAQGLGTYGTDIFAGQLPPSPDTAIAVILFGGGPPLATFGEPLAIQRPTVQILVRGATYETGRDKVEIAYRLLSALHNVLIDDVWYMGCNALPPSFIGADANGRAMFSMNAELLRTDY
jgi:hypothetical protein